MKTIDEFLSELRYLDVKLWIDGDRLRYRASKETLTPALLRELRERKAELLTFLHTANTAASSNLPPILPATRNGNLSLSFAQQRLWFLEQLQPGSSVHNISVAYRLIGSFNVTALKWSLGEIVRRHEILRTTFLSVDGQASQVIAPDITLPLTVIDLRELPPNQRETEAQRKAAEEDQQPFDLTQGSLLRVKLLCLTEEEHVLLLTMHHIVSDGWSLEVFFQELTALHKAFCANKPSPLAELPIQYADFAHWQRQWLQDEVLKPQLEYWKQQLGGSLPLLQLPTDHPQPPVQSYQGAVHRLMLPKTLTKALKALSQRSGVTLFMLLLAAFKILLYRYSRQEDIIVGSPTAGRNQVETEGMIGFFINTLVLRTDLSGNPSFRELLGRVREVSLRAYAHQDLPFEKLVEELQPKRDLSHNPLFQVMFVLQNAPMERLELPGLTITPLEIESVTAKFDLTLLMEEIESELRGALEYNTDLFDAATITRMAGHFQTLLEGIVANPEQRVSELPLLTAAQRHQLLVEWNDTQTDYPQDACIHQLFEAQVERSPDAVAVVFKDKQLSYRELNSRANHLAHYLRSLGVGPEVLVGIYVERSLDMVVGLLGILKAGGAYVPLDSAYPKERLAFMLEDAQVPILLTQEKLVAGLSELGAHVVCLDTDWGVTLTESKENPVSQVKSDNLAYVIYTSGSTGKPKGTMLVHQGLVNYLSWCTKAYAVADGCGAPVQSSIGFDATITSLFSPLLVGKSVLLLPEKQEIEALSAALSENNFSLVKITPAHLDLLSQLLPTKDAKGQKRALIIGGEALLRESLSFWLTHVPDTRLINEYGPTETVVGCCVYEVTAQLSLSGTVPIGRPIANTQIYILDQYLQPVPVGVPGELHIGGAGVARGYLNRPELTVEKFIPNCFSDQPGARLYKTGDLARYLPDGNIEFLGRIDNQVKIRAFRIEIEEIEAVLAQHPEVFKAVVIAREDHPSDKRLVAYVIAKQEQVLTPSELRRFLKQKLPDYMVPSAFVLLSSLPVTPNGKVDHRALPEPDQVRRPEETFVTSRDELELQLAKIWEKVLGIEPIGVRDNFFDLGGHSLLAMRLFAQIEKTFHNNLPLATLFQAPTVEQLASILRQKEWSAPWSSLVTIQTGGSKPPLFCIHGGGFNILVYRDLANYMGPDQPVYGLQAKGLDGKEAPHKRIEDMAADYIRQMRTVQPEGPYFLGGLSNGGNIAFEMAQQLHEQGQHVALLALFDSYGSDSFELLPPIPRLLSVLRYALRYSLPRFGGKLIQFKPKATLTQVLDKVRTFKKISDEQSSKATAGQLKVEQLLDGTERPSNSSYLERWIDNLSMFILEFSPWAFLAPKTELQSIGGSLPDALQKIEEAHSKAQEAYVLRVYPGRITIFLANERPPGFYTDPQLGWGGIAAGGLEMYEIPGHHTSIVQSPVLAEKLRACLDKAQVKG